MISYQSVKGVADLVLEGLWRWEAVIEQQPLKRQRKMVQSCVGNTENHASIGTEMFALL
jgi:hypothetical protein